MTRKVAVLFLVAAVFATFTALPAVAATEPIAYPAKGQSAAQMDQDKAACYSWAKDQTGFDPMQAPAPPPAAAPQGGVLRGATKGALVGVAVGAVAGDAGKGAAIGAASGGTVGAIRKRQRQKDQQAATQQQAATADQQRSEYNRSFGACLEDFYTTQT